MVRKRNKLYTANKWNRPLFAEGVDREHHNIFDGMFSSTLNTPSSQSAQSQGVGLNWQTPQLTKPSLQNSTVWDNLGQSMRATGYTQSLVNDFHNNAAQNNVFSQLASNNAGDSSSNNGNTGNSTGGSGFLSSLGSAGVAGGLNALDSIKIGNTRRGLWDTADPLYYLAGDKQSSVGNGLSDAGIETFKAGAQSGNGWTMLAGGIMKGTGSLINAAWGMSTDEDRLNNITAGTKALNNFQSNASSFDEVQGPAAVVNNTDGVYKGGWFKKSKARRKNEELRKEVAQAEARANRSVENNIENIAKTQMDNMEANYAAMGGFLDTGNNMSAINYNFMSDYLTAKNKAAENKNKMPSNVFGNLAVTPLTTFALGGDMQTNGSDWSDGLTVIGAGGSHEQNPYEGVQVGISRENGQPNLVEEGETIFDDYVFSRRIKPDARTKKKFHVGKNSDMSFADLSKKLEKESEERPNDAISQAGLTKQMHELADEQERQKEEQQKAEMEAAFAQLPPEQQQAIMQQVAMQEQQAEQQAMQGQQMPEETMAQQEPQQQVEEQMVQQQPDMAQMEGQQGEVQMAACGGKLNKFADGGDKGEAMKRKIYSLLPNVYTDSDFDRWAYDQKIDRITDWEHILDNKQFMDALGASNPALGDVIGKGYLGDYKIPTSKYDLAGFNKTLDNYTKSKEQGNTDGNYQPDKEFPLGDFKSIQDLENSDRYRAYTQYMKDVIGRAKGIKWSVNNTNNFKPDPALYDVVQWQDDKNKLSREDFNALMTLMSHANGTSTNPAGSTVPLFGVDGIYSYVKDDADTLFEKYRTDGKGGIFHFTPDEIKRDKNIVNRVVDDKGNIEDIIGDVPKDWTRISNYSWQDDKSDNTYNYYRRPTASTDGTTADGNGANEEEKLGPKHGNEKLRYAGLLGPAVGLGMQLAGIGKPDYSHLDAAVEASSGTPALAQTKYLGNYLRYNPMDIWYEQNRLNANSRATDRAIMNNGSPLGTKMAGLLANGYNNQIASGNLFRQALEYNDAQRQKVAEFNRGTDQFNASAFNQTSATNAQLQNNHKNFKAQMLMDAARQRMASDAAWNQGIYGNVQGIFKGISDLGRENAQHNMIADMAADGLFGNMSDKQHIARTYLEKKKAANGGKVNRRKGRRGLTF